MIIYIDMDDTIFNMMGAYNEQKQYQKHPQKLPGFFASFEPLPGAVEAVNALREKHDVWIATAPSVRNPNSYTDKRLLIEKTFDYDFCSKLIITPNKGLLIGDVLIDDYDHGRGQEYFQGELIHFGSTNYPDWQSVMKHLDGRKCKYDALERAAQEAQHHSNQDVISLFENATNEEISAAYRPDEQLYSDD